MAVVINRPTTSAEAIKALNTAANVAGVKVALTGEVAEKLEKRLVSLAKNQPATAFGLLVYLDDLQQQGRLTFADAGRIPSAGAAQKNALNSLVTSAKTVLNSNATISDDLKQDLLMR